MPPEAREDSPPGAEAFARYYMTALDYAYQTGTTSLLRTLARCTGCNAVANGIEAFHKQGGHYEGGRFTIHTAKATGYVRSSRATITLRYSRAERILVSSSGAREVVKGEKNLGLRFSEQRRSGNWTITKVQTIT